MRAQGAPLATIARRFGWSDTTTRQRLADEVYIGTIRHGAFVKENAHPAIVPRDLFDAVQAARTIREAAPGALTRDRLLQGLARCGGCGRTLKVIHRPARLDGTRVASYYCKDAATDACPDRAYVHCEDLETFVVEWFERALRKAPNVVDVVAAGAELEQAQGDLAAAEKQLAAFVENADVVTDAAVFRRGVEARQQRVDEARARVQELSGRVTRLPLGGSLLDLWAAYAPPERRHVLDGFLDRIVVTRGASRDLKPNVRVFWADGTLALGPKAERRVRVAAA